jgi:hypothetical protein
MRISSVTLISDKRMGVELFTNPLRPDIDFVGDTFSSTKVFHSPQPGQFPSHFGDS